MSRRSVHLAVGAALLLSASACTKPSPIVTIVTNGHSVHAAASNYCFGGKTLVSEDQCVADGPRTTSIEVRPGDTVGIDVDSDLADTGWVVYDPISKLNGDLHKDHYLTFTADFGQSASVAVLEIHQVQPAGTDTQLNKVLGIWRFQLKRKDS